MNRALVRWAKKALKFFFGKPLPAVDDGPWAAEEVDCDHCGHYWVAVHPCAEYLQCPICQKLTPSIADVAGYLEKKEKP